MRTLRLKRLKSNSMGTLGIITLDGVEVCQSIELPWVDVEHDVISDKKVSCIPDGVYFCKRDMYHAKGYEVFEVQNVPGRDQILIHIGNYLRDTNGCILVGLQRGESNGQYCVYKSKPAFDILMKLLKDEKEICLEITS